MWPSQGPPPPVASTNPAYPPGYSYPCNSAAPGVFPQPYPPSQYPPSQYPPGQYPPGQLPPYQYPGMVPNPHPGAMPYGCQGVHAYPAAPGGYPHVSPMSFHPGPFPHSPKGYHFNHHKGHHRYYPPHHHGNHLMPGGLGLKTGLVAVGMGLMGHKANKKMKKKMKKAHKGHKYWHGKSSSSSSDSD